MSVIIRLQNLPWSANALDVRGYFLGLSIPDGGVHIVGGENGDAFIAFSTDEDARQAMMLDGGKIKEVQVHLLLSSRAEMQKVIETARQTTISYMKIPITQVQTQQQSTTPLQTQNSTTMSSSLSGLLSQQMLQQQKINNSNVNDLTSTNLLKLTMPHHITINDNSNDSKDSRDREISITSSKDLSDSKNDRDKKRDFDRRDRKSRSRSRSDSRSRDRRRSRSYERGSRNSRRRRSRSRDRDRRSKRSRRSKSRDRSRERNDRDRKLNKLDTNVNNSNINEMTTIPALSLNQSNKPSSVWEATSSNVISSSINHNSNKTNLSSTLNVYSTDTLSSVTPKPMYSPEEITKLHQLDKMRNLSAFQTGQEPLFTTNMQFNNNINNIDRNITRHPTHIPPPNIAPPNIVTPNIVTPPSITTLNLQQYNPLLEHNQHIMQFIPPLLISHTDVIEGKCIKLTNMHLITGYGEIRRFFHGLQINQNGIKMINDQKGQRTGTAIIKFIRKDSKKIALTKNGAILRGEIIKITDIPDEDFDNAIDSFKPVYNNANRNNYNYDFNYHNNDGSKDSYEDDDNNDNNNDDDRDDDDDDNDDNDNENVDKNDDSDDDVQYVSSDTVQPLINVSETKPFSTLMLDDLPPFTKEQDILKLFTNYSLMHIVLGKIKNSKQLQGFVKFHRPDDAKSALNDTAHHLIAHKAVTVSVCSEENYEAAKRELSSDTELMEKLSRPPPSQPTQTNPTINSNFPSDPRQTKSNYVGKSDYKSESKDNDSRNFNNKMYSTNTNNNTNTVDTNDSTMSRNGSLDPRINYRNNRGNENHGSGSGGGGRANNNWSSDVNYQNNYRTREESISNTTNNDSTANRNNDPRFRNNQNEILKTDCVAISNLEFKTTDRDVIDFFSDIGLIPLRVHILLTTQGDPSGDCFCEFGSTEDAARAITKNNTHLGLNNVCVEYIPRQKVEDILLSFKNSQSHSDGDMNERSNNYRGNNNRGGRENYRNNNGNNNNNNSYQRSYNNNNNNNNNNVGRGPISMQMPNNQPIRPLLGYPINNMNVHQNINPIMGMNIPPPSLGGDFNTPGCVVSLENVPYRAGVDDILEFFSDFKLKQENVMRRYNDNGTPTGDARVCFISPAEAKRAIDTKRHGKISNRTIYLNILQN